MKYKILLFLSKFRKHATPEEYEKSIGLEGLKKTQLRLFLTTERKIFLGENIKQKGKYWLACSPEWQHGYTTKYRIVYWVNYGDDMTFGRFTVEDIITWLTNEHIQLHTLGGTKER